MPNMVSFFIYNNIYVVNNNSVVYRSIKELWICFLKKLKKHS